jgi:hypothetical protein
MSTSIDLRPFLEQRHHDVTESPQGILRKRSKPECLFDPDPIGVMRTQALS